ncbi:MAG TPA: hypothetical protein VE010_19800, partial [Thermoanaerobaculia bacterium]|nr:hypothetical protein [Thermoanaerobaculia bacterium]
KRRLASPHSNDAAPQTVDTQLATTFWSAATPVAAFTRKDRTAQEARGSPAKALAPVILSFRMTGWCGFQ